MTKEQAERAGLQLVQMLNLKQINGEFERPRYDTAWGSKTLEGLGRCIERIVEESKQ